MEIQIMSLTTCQIVLDNYDKAESHFYSELTVKNVIIKQLCLCVCINRAVNLMIRPRRYLWTALHILHWLCGNTKGILRNWCKHGLLLELIAAERIIILIKKYLLNKEVRNGVLACSDSMLAVSWFIYFSLLSKNILTVLSNQLSHVSLHINVLSLSLSLSRSVLRGLFSLPYPHW